MACTYWTCPLASQNSRCNCQSRCWGVRLRSAWLWCHITVCWGETLHVEKMKQRSGARVYCSLYHNDRIHTLMESMRCEDGRKLGKEKSSDISVTLLTCIINSIPHFKTTDGAGFVFIITFEDQLQRIKTSRFFFFLFYFFFKLWAVRNKGDLNCPTCHALIFFHKCLNSCRFSRPVPSVWKWFSYGKIAQSIACYVILKVNMGFLFKENERLNQLVLFLSFDLFFFKKWHSQK